MCKLGKQYKFYDKELLDLHLGNSVLLVNKYVLTSIPDPQLEFLLENQNIENFNAELPSEHRFIHSICELDSVYSEIFTPNIKAEHYNPYKRWLSCVNSGNKTCNNLLDLCGVGCKDEFGFDGHDIVFYDVVTTFPSEVDYFLVNPVVRDIIIKRLHKCRVRFFEKLSASINVVEGNELGMSSSLHVWSSTCPVLPNAHLHNIIPGLSLSFKESVIEVCNDWRQPRIRDVPIKYPDSLKNEFIERFSNFIDVVDNGIKKTFVKKSYGSNEVDTHHIIESKRVERFIDDDFYSDFLEVKSEMSISMANYFNFKSIPWFSNRFPLDANAIKELWSDVVYDEFGKDIMDCWKSLDVHINFISSTNKSKLLHALQYKVRPPVLDLDLFFKQCPDFITYYDSMDADKILDWLNYQLQININCSNYDNICKFESLLTKAENIFDNYSKEDLFNWLEFLSVYKTNTRILGFWSQFKTFQLDPEHTLFPVSNVCPICDGVVSNIGYVNSLNVDVMIVRHRNSFMVFDFDGG